MQPTLQDSALCISTHALREEGDPCPMRARRNSLNFYPRPPRGGRHCRHRGGARGVAISTHALREEGDIGSGEVYTIYRISTHALREEGDGTAAGKLSSTTGNFYPRPPRGGRRLCAFIFCFERWYFYPRPPRGGRQDAPGVSDRIVLISTHALREEGDAKPYKQNLFCYLISTHALREEGDKVTSLFLRYVKVFLPTPSARRATQHTVILNLDAVRFLPTPSARRATVPAYWWYGRLYDFYPRPPRGGRRRGWKRSKGGNYFYPRPPRGGRQLSGSMADVLQDFYPRPPRGGRPKCRCCTLEWRDFYPRPPRGGRPTVKMTKPLYCYFYPRPPRGGRRFALDVFVTGVPDFYPRPPRGGRLGHVSAGWGKGISTHALREEGDVALAYRASSRK